MTDDHNLEPDAVVEASEADQVSAGSEHNGHSGPAMADAGEAATGLKEKAAAPEGDEAPLALEDQLAKAEAKAAEYLDGWQRARAEFDNARKRMERQRQEAYINATVELVGKLLPALDDYARALHNVPESVAADPWFEGITLVERKLRGILEAYRIEPIPTVGEPFDPQIHEAVSQEPSDDYENGTVIRELQKGYRLGERVVRAALVIVAA